MTIWKQYYKLDEYGHPCHAQMSYEPLINKECTVFCMNFDPYNSYTNYLNRIGFIPEIVSDFFDREVEYLNRFQGYKWLPEVLDIDYTSRKIFFKWYNNTCNDIINAGNQLPLDWKIQVEQIIKQQLENRVYKLTQYPHCFYIDDNALLHTFDFHASFDFDNCKIPYYKIKGLIHKDSMHRIEESLEEDRVDMKVMFENGLRYHIKWPEEIHYD
jgi:hypothetical protein